MNAKLTVKSKNVKASEAAGARFVQTASVMDDCGTGQIVGQYMTPAQEREYNDGMARMAEMFG